MAMVLLLVVAVLSLAVVLMVMVIDSDGDGVVVGVCVCVSLQLVNACCCSRWHSCHKSVRVGAGTAANTLLRGFSVRRGLCKLS